MKLSKFKINKSYSNLYLAKCKHVACLTCWEKWLEKTLDCPQCRNRTRRNQIFPMNKQDKKEVKGK